jgi:hypothetical protein
MDLPSPRNRKMNRVDVAVDSHDATFAVKPIAVARVERLDEAYAIAGKGRRRVRQLRQIFDADKIAAGMEGLTPGAERSH